MDKVCSTNGGENKAHKLLRGELEGKRPIGRPRRRSVDNTKIELGEKGLVDWIGLAQDGGPVESSCEHGNEPSGFLEIWMIFE
jgi:hypothetical protein